MNTEMNGKEETAEKIQPENPKFTVKEERERRTGPVLCSDQRDIVEETSKTCVCGWGLQTKNEQNSSERTDSETRFQSRARSYNN